MGNAAKSHSWVAQKNNERDGKIFVNDKSIQQRGEKYQLARDSIPVTI